MDRIMLDAFCCKGGAGMGYHQSGYNVVGVDIEPQPGYPFPFIQADAIDYISKHGTEFHLIHGSPPCQGYSNLNAYNHAEYPRLISKTRHVMAESGVPYVIENVESARDHLISPVLMCGTMCNLKMYRHRLFECSFPVKVPDHPRHAELCARNGYLPTLERPFMSIHGGKHSRAWQRKACEVMETPWMAVKENAGVVEIQEGIRAVCEAIPPAYTKLIGDQARIFTDRVSHGKPIYNEPEWFSDKPVYICIKCGAESTSNYCPRNGCNGPMRVK